MGIFEGVLLLTDLDGTMLDDNKQIGAKTREAVAFFQAEGGKFSAATGRLHRFFRPLEQGVPLNCPAVVCNGGYLYDYSTGEVWGMHTVSRDAEAVVEAVAERFPEVCAEINSFATTYVRGWNDISAHHISIMKLDPVHVSHASEAVEDWSKVLFTVPVSSSEALAKYLRENHPRYYYTFSTPEYFELMPPGVNKGSAALELAEHLGISRENVYCAGDHLNDLDMLRVSACAYVPANARPEALAIAGHVLPDNNHDSIAALIEDLETKYRARA